MSNEPEQVRIPALPRHVLVERAEKIRFLISNVDGDWGLDFAEGVGLDNRLSDYKRHGMWVDEEQEIAEIKTYHRDGTLKEYLAQIPDEYLDKVRGFRAEGKYEREPDGVYISTHIKLYTFKTADELFAESKAVQKTASKRR